MQPRKVYTTHKFDKDVALAVRQGKDTQKLRKVIELLVIRSTLPRELRDHPLKGQWKGYRDLHLEPDWLLIYKVDQQNLWLVRTGTHGDIFGL
ncbi:MAG: type II toxin-antitoxin system YafQ family toxin [Candidatus Methylumidiphilus sp.]